MSLPGFAAAASLYDSPNTYAGTVLPASGVMTPASLPGVGCVAACVALALELRMGGGLGASLQPGDFTTIMQVCAASCGVAFTPALARAVMAELLGTSQLAAGVGAGGVLAALLVALAVVIGLDIWESTVRPTELPSGAACNSTPAHRAPQRIKVSAWGCNRSLAQAVDAANAACAALPACPGSCAPGKRCRSAAAVDRTTQARHAFWCDTRVYFTCPCECV